MGVVSLYETYQNAKTEVLFVVLRWNYDVEFQTGALQIKNNLTGRYQKPEIEFQLLMEAEEKVKSWETFGIKSNLRWNDICTLTKNSMIYAK